MKEEKVVDLIDHLTSSVCSSRLFVSLCPDEDDEGERDAVPLAALDGFFSDDDSLKQQQQKKKKAKKMKEGKTPKVKKRKKEVRCNSVSPPVALHVSGSEAADRRGPGESRCDVRG